MHGDEYFPYISNEDEVDAASDLFEEAYAAFHQIPNLSYLL